MTTTYGDPRGELWCQIPKPEDRGIRYFDADPLDNIGWVLGQVTTEREWSPPANALINREREGGMLCWRAVVESPIGWNLGASRSGHAANLHTAMRHAKAALELLREMEAMLGELDPDEPDDRPGRVLTREGLKPGTIATDGPVHIANMDQAREMLGEGSSLLDLVADQFERHRAVSEAAIIPQEDIDAALRACTPLPRPLLDYIEEQLRRHMMVPGSYVRARTRANGEVVVQLWQNDRLILDVCEFMASELEAADDPEAFIRERIEEMSDAREFARDY